MKNVDDVLNFVRENTKWNSDYKIGRELLGYGNTAQISGWRRRVAFPNNRDLIKMCEASKMDLGEAVRAIEYSRENERPLKEAGFIDLSVLGVLSMSSFGGMSILNMTQLPYEAIGTAMLGASIVYYVKSNEYELLEIKGQLRTLSSQELLKLVASNDIEACQISAHSVN